MTDAVHITDLARPTFTPDAQQIIDGMSAMAQHCPLTADALHEQASAQTGLSDFGEQDYRERMSVPPRAFGELPNFTAFGRTYAFSLMLTFLKGRLRVVDHLKNHPEIFNIEGDRSRSSLVCRAPAQRICTACWPPTRHCGRCRIGRLRSHCLPPARKAPSNPAGNAPAMHSTSQHADALFPVDA